jgi:hypothetical protein
MDAMTAVITTQFTMQMAATYEDRFCTLEGYKVVTFEPKVTTEKALQGVRSPAHLIVQSSAYYTLGNNILFFIII